MNATHADVSEQTLKTREFKRDQVEVLRGRLYLLDGREKVMMVMHVENGSSFRQIARLVGLCESTVARKIHTLSRRLIDSEYIACLRNRNNLTKTQMAVARDYFLKGLSKREIAQKKRWSRYKVGRTVDEIRGIVGRAQRRSH
ncbi:MAG: hypothetical protein U9Q07_08940 [Planctomycetota bacterium]|nr:hypothetical protein [Planctomycetota bacterium]